MTGNVKLLVAYRPAQARETLQAGRELLAGRHYRDAVNRGYYAMFYATLGMLASEQLGTSKHTGVMSLFTERFVKTGRFPVEKAVYLRRAFELRQKCDYREFAEPAEAEASEILTDAVEFIDAAAACLEREAERR